jgi:carbon storage regulator CsrA
MNNRNWLRTPHPKLVLARHPGERIIIPHYDMIIAVEGIRGTQAHISFSAPKEVGIYREEIWKSLQTSTQT